MKDSNEHKLAAPGAGLPGPELLIARFVFRKFRNKHNADELNQLIQTHSDALCLAASNCDEATGRAQVLIKRLRGLEDSSRDWSVFMTLEHVRIVNDMVNGVMMLLSNGRVPDSEASTASVKPSPNVGSEVIEGLKESSGKLIERSQSIENLKTETKYAHPWFGELDAASWHAMAAFHMGLHVKQVESILEKMKDWFGRKSTELAETLGLTELSYEDLRLCSDQSSS